eukprot:4400891-Lingulodinium_polyedra.AAC.1
MGLFKPDPVEPDETQSKVGGQKRKASAVQDSSDSGSDLDDDDVIAAHFKKLEDKRADLDGLAPYFLEDFRAVRRADGDAWQGQVVRGGEAQAWCKRSTSNRPRRHLCVWAMTGH